MREPIDDTGDIPNGSPVSEIARWCQDIAGGEGHRVTISEHGRDEYKVEFRYYNVNLTVFVDEVTGVPGLDRDGVAIGRCSEVELTEATTVGLSFADFEERRER